MNLLLDSFWRAAADCLRPRVIALSMLPLILMVALFLTLGYFYWDSALDGVRGLLEGSSLLATLFEWLQGVGAEGFKTVLAPLIIVFAITPLIVVLSLLVVAIMMTPSLVNMVAKRRFSLLERKYGGSLLVSLVWSLGSTMLAFIALVVSVPLWLIPPLILVLPPLIWGWLTYRVMAFDALADHASKAERVELLRRHRSSLLAIGVITGYMGVAPSLIWASGALFVVFFVVLVPIAIWIYTLVFAFSSLWFAHYSLSALQTMRAIGNDTPAPTSTSTPAPAILPHDDRL